MVRKKLESLIEKSLKELQEEKILPVFELKLSLENNIHGDYSSNVAMILAKEAKKSPFELAEAIKAKCQKDKSLEKIEIAGPGFINFFISNKYLEKEIEEIIKQKKNFGKLDIGKKEKVNIEFISANPTGPLHIGNARGGFCGDVLANVLNKAGYKAFREYYVNNMGNQVKVLKDSLEGKEGYKNEYIAYLFQKGVKDPKKAVEYIVKKIQETVSAMGIKYDKWFYESELFDSKEVEKVKEELKNKGLVFEKEGALWFKSSEFGDDKDRVLVKEDKSATYLLPDIAYLKNKFKRGFEKIVMFLGADHHGYIGRLKAAAEAIGYSKENVSVIIAQLVRLIENGKELKMSKRSGTFITIDEVLKEVGLDAARFFFLTRNYGNHLDFDLDLAKEQSSKNPVFYVQYAYARISSILKKSKQKRGEVSIEKKEERDLAKELLRFPEVIEDISLDYQIQRLPKYATDIAEAFHKFYQECQVISEDKDLTKKRISLVLATKIVLENTLELMGISAPKKM